MTTVGVPKRKPKNAPERDLQNHFRIWASERIKDVRVFVRSVGVFELEDGRVFRAGLRGQSDLYAITKGGRHIEIEVKSKTGKLTPDQERWRDWCQSFGVPWFLLKPEGDETQGQTLERGIQMLRAAMKEEPISHCEHGVPFLRCETCALADYIAPTRTG